MLHLTEKKCLNGDEAKNSVTIVLVQDILEYCLTDRGTVDLSSVSVALIVLLSRPLKFIASSEIEKNENH